MEKFVPYKNEKRTISLLIDIRTLEKVDLESAKVDISRNEFIAQCIEFALRNKNEGNEIIKKESNKNKETVNN